MENKKIMLITGSSGRVGRAAVDRFGDQFQIVGFDRHEAQHSKNVDHVLMDVGSDESVEQAFEIVRDRYGDNIGPVLHLAAYYSFSGSHPELYDKITVQGTERVLNNLQSFNVDQFFFASTLLVHKPCKLGETINENSPIDARWDYPKSKVNTEKVMFEKHGKIPLVIYRIAGCYDDDCHSIPISHNIQRIYQHEFNAHLYPGDVSHGNPFLHMNDLMDAFDLAMQKKEQLPNELVLIIGEDKTIGYKDLQNQISELLDGKDFDLFRVPKWLAKEGATVEQELPFFDDNFIQPWMIDVADDHYALDISKAKQTLGWTPKHFLGTSLSVMINRLKEDPLGWYQTNGLKAPKHLIQHIREQKKAHV